MLKFSCFIHDIASSYSHENARLYLLHWIQAVNKVSGLLALDLPWSQSLHPSGQRAVTTTRESGTTRATNWHANSTVTTYASDMIFRRMSFLNSAGHANLRKSSVCLEGLCESSQNHVKIISRNLITLSFNWQQSHDYCEVIQLPSDVTRWTSCS